MLEIIPSPRIQRKIIVLPKVFVATEHIIRSQSKNQELKKVGKYPFKAAEFI
jgi:hypothetical protein